jgi:hypothetical protein
MSIDLQTISPWEVGGPNQNICWGLKLGKWEAPRAKKSNSDPSLKSFFSNSKSPPGSRREVNPAYRLARREERELRMKVKKDISANISNASISFTWKYTDPVNKIFESSSVSLV